jgi:hypothetical protein
LNSTISHLLVASDNNVDCLTLVSQWRRSGLRVVVSVDESKGEELWRRAQEMNIPLAATWTGQGFDVYGLNQEQPASAAFVPYAEASTIVQRALSVSPVQQELR